MKLNFELKDEQRDSLTETVAGNFFSTVRNLSVRIFVRSCVACIEPVTELCVTGDGYEMNPAREVCA